MIRGIRNIPLSLIVEEIHKQRGMARSILVGESSEESVALADGIRSSVGTMERVIARYLITNDIDKSEDKIQDIIKELRKMGDEAEVQSNNKTPLTINTNKELEIRIFLDGDQWCALQGPDLQEGEYGFGDTPEEAFENLMSAIWTPVRQ